MVVIKLSCSKWMKNVCWCSVGRWAPSVNEYEPLGNYVQREKPVTQYQPLYAIPYYCITDNNNNVWVCEVPAACRIIYCIEYYMKSSSRWREDVILFRFYVWHEVKNSSFNWKTRFPRKNWELHLTKIYI